MVLEDEETLGMSMQMQPPEDLTAPRVCALSFRHLRAHKLIVVCHFMCSAELLLLGEIPFHSNN